MTTMKTINELFDTWNNITPYSEGFLLVSEDHPLSFHIGVHGEKEKIFVVLNTGKIDNIYSSEAVSAENIQLSNGSYALQFSLKRPSLTELFVKLCWDLMEVSRNAPDPLSQFITQYEKWQKLLQRVGDGGLSIVEQKGLIGELLFIKERAAVEGIDATLTAWIGPEGADQDFDFPNYWVEVKSTTIDGNTFSVSSIQQLNRDTNGFIVVYFMDRTTSDGQNHISLTSLVEEIEHFLKSEKQKNIFACKLARIGYQDSDKDKYKKHKFRLEKHEFFKVTSDFPRLTRNNIPSEIVDATYNISLAAISSFKTSEI